MNGIDVMYSSEVLQILKRWKVDLDRSVHRQDNWTNLISHKLIIDCGIDKWLNSNPE